MNKLKKTLALLLSLVMILSLLPAAAFAVDELEPEEISELVEEEAQAPVVEEKKEEAPTITDVKDVKRFHNIVEMRAAMAELGFEGVQGMGYLQLKYAASKEGYDFQIQKN